MSNFMSRERGRRENLGWKVYRVPETATVLMSGGISFGELNDEQVFDFQVRKNENKRWISDGN